MSELNLFNNDMAGTDLPANGLSADLLPPVKNDNRLLISFILSLVSAHSQRRG
jgi:hypothetical protein